MRSLLMFPCARVPDGGFTPETSLSNLSFWTHMANEQILQPENMLPEWSDHSTQVYDMVGLIHNRYNPSWEYLANRRLHYGKAYTTPTEDPPSEYEHDWAVANEYYDIPDNDIPPLEVHEDAQGTEMFYLFVQVTQLSKTWKNNWVVQHERLGVFKQFCLICFRWVEAPGQSTHHYTTLHQQWLQRYKDSGGAALLQQICYNLPVLLTHGSAYASTTVHLHHEVRSFSSV